MMSLIWLLISILNFILLFTLFYTKNFIFILLIILLLFFNINLISFTLGLELMPLLILLVVLGALLILIIFALFILNQKNIFEKTVNTKFYLLILLIITKIFYFISSLKFYSFTQIWLLNLINEKESLVFFYSLNPLFGYGPVLLIIGVLLLSVTLGVSLIFKKN